MPKPAVINALQSSGDASYDRARETLKGVSVDASGKVELEDWVEVSIITTSRTQWMQFSTGFSAQCQAQGAGHPDPPDQGREGHRSGLECKR